jgi:methyl-accepting chemotaxis protein
MAMQLDITALETSFDLVAPKREELVDRFYRRLFTDAPATRALFAHTDMRAQKRALLGALVALRRSLRDLSSIAPFLADLGARHAGYGVRAEHYPVVGAVLLETMAEVAGAAWLPAFTSESCVPRNSGGLEAMIMGLTCENGSRHASEACL